MSDVIEEWRDIAGYEWLYQVSDQGRVRSLNYRHTGKIKILKADKHSNGYLYVHLYKNNIQKALKIHRLVAEAFIDNPDNKPQIDHVNTIRYDNRAENLRWCTQKENCNNHLSLVKFSEAHKGKHHSDETKKKLSEARKGKPNTALSKTVYMIDPNTGNILNVFRSTRDAGRVTGISHVSISACCLGYQKTAGGYCWEYIPTIE